MNYKKLNHNWNANPNAPGLKLEKGEQYIEFTFALNSFSFEYIDEEDIGELEFSSVYAYKVGPPNDEGYFVGKHRFADQGLPWGEFYEILNSNWVQDFPKDAVILDIDSKGPALRHFVFFTKEETIEVLAKDFFFMVDFGKSSFFEERYPEDSVDHYLCMYGINQSDLSQESFQAMNAMYVSFEGREEFDEVKKEVHLIRQNNDMDWFLKTAYWHGLEGINMEKLDEMFDAILSF